MRQAAADLQSAIEAFRVARAEDARTFGSLKEQLETTRLKAGSLDVLERISKAFEDWHERARSLVLAANRTRAVWREAIYAVFLATQMDIESDPLLEDEEQSEDIEKALEQKARECLVAIGAAESWREVADEARRQGLPVAPLPTPVALREVRDTLVRSESQIRQDLERHAEMQQLQQFIVDRLDDITWSPLAEDALPSGGWARILKATENSVSAVQLHGLALRLYAETNPADLTEEVRRCCEFPATAGDDTRLDHLSFLPRNRLEELYDREPVLRRPIQVSLIRTLFFANRDDYWFWTPLATFTIDAGTHRRAKTVDRFIAKIAELSMQRSSATVAALLRTTLGATNVQQNPEKDREKLWGRLRAPLQCGDRSRFRFRQLAHDELFPKLRAAVDERDAVRTATIAGEIRDDVDLPALYERWSDEIGLRTRNMATHVLHDVHEIVELAIAWANGELARLQSRTSDLGRIAEELEEVNTLGDATGDQEDKAAAAALSRWARLVGDGGPSAAFSAEFPGTLLNEPLPVSLAREPLGWRTFSQQLEIGATSWSFWIKDQLQLWAAPPTPTTAFAEMLEAGALVAAQKAAEAFSGLREGISKLDLDRLAVAIENRNRALEGKREEMLRIIGTLPNEDSAIFLREVPEVPHPHTQSACEEFERTIQELSLRVDTALVDRGDPKVRERLNRRLTFLGNPLDKSAAYASLEEAWHKVYAANASRRQHLVPIRNFARFTREAPGCEALADLAEVALSDLEEPEAWPDAERSSDLALYLTVLLEDGLRPKLRDAVELRSGPRRNLERLAYAWVTALGNSSWLHDPAAEWSNALRETAELSPFQIDLGLDVVRNHSLVAPANVEATASEEKPTSDPPKSAHSALVAAFDHILPAVGLEPVAPAAIRIAVEAGRWADAAQLAGSEFRRLESDGKSGTTYAGELFRDFAGSYLLSLRNAWIAKPEQYSDLLHDINSAPRGVIRDHHRALGELFLGGFLQFWAVDQQEAASEAFRTAARAPVATLLPDGLGAWLRRAFSPCDFNAGSPCPTVEAAWTVLPREKSGSDEKVRGWLLWACWQTEQWDALQQLLVSSADGLESPVANTFCRLLQQREKNSARLEAFVLDLRRRFSSRAPTFLNFTDRVLRARDTVDKKPVNVSLLGALQPSAKGSGWLGQVQIVPPDVAPPKTLEIVLPEIAPIRFKGGALRYLVEGGPFLDEVEQHLHFEIRDPRASATAVQVECCGLTLHDEPYTTVEHWDIILNTRPFTAPSVEIINRVFAGFNQDPVRGARYVTRVQDERKLTDLLFNIGCAGSVWLNAPRRSGKTSLLLWLIDTFSWRPDRDEKNGFIFCDLGGWDTALPLQRKIWSKLLEDDYNEPFRKIIPGQLKTLDTVLPLAGDDIGTFLGKLIERLIAASEGRLERVFVLFDEVDHFRSFHYQARDRCAATLWQLREFKQKNRCGGLVFASSDAAARLFVDQDQAPFYNSIDRHALVRFSAAEAQDADASRQIVQPEELLEFFDPFPVETLAHIVKAASGLPFYMKQVAGAAFTAARSRYVSRTDVNRGVERLLAHDTGLKADSLVSPGKAEMSSLYSADGARRALAKAVILAAASLLKGLDHPYIMKDDLLRSDGPLRVDARLPEQLIREGIAMAIEQGFLEIMHAGQEYLAFTIPILGESLRAEFHKQWYETIPELEELIRFPSAASSPTTRIRHAEETGAPDLSLRGQVVEVIHQELHESRMRGRRPYTATIGWALVRAFPGVPVHERLGFGKLNDLIKSLPQFVIQGQATEHWIALASAVENDNASCERGASTEDLEEEVRQFILVQLSKCEREGRDLALPTLGNRLLRRFPGDRIYRRLQFATLGRLVCYFPDFWITADGLVKRAQSTHP